MLHLVLNMLTVVIFIISIKYGWLFMWLSHALVEVLVTVLVSINIMDLENSTSVCMHLFVRLYNLVQLATVCHQGSAILIIYLHVTFNILSHSPPGQSYWWVLAENLSGGNKIYAQSWCLEMLQVYVWMSQITNKQIMVQLSTYRKTNLLTILHVLNGLNFQFCKSNLFILQIFFYFKCLGCISFTGKSAHINYFKQYFIIAN